MVRVGLVVAMRAEVPLVTPYRGTGAVATCEVGQVVIGLLVSGIGQRKAHAAAQRICQEFHPDYVLSLGACGAVAEGLAVGDLVIAEDVVSPQGARISLESWRSAEAIEVARKGQLPYRLGTLQSFYRPVLARRGILPGTLAVDMESYAIAEVARERGLPAVIVRAISDVVPEQVDPRALWAWLHHLTRDFTIAKRQLDRFAELYFHALSA